MSIASLFAGLILPLLIAAVCLYIINRLRLPRRRPKRRSRFGFYPVAAGNALQAIQAIVQPSARHTLALRFEDQADEDDSDSGGPRIPSNICTGKPPGSVAASQSIASPPCFPPNPQPLSRRIEVRSC